MPASTETRCRRCGRALAAHRDPAGLFEGMHWVCFHYEFEHDPTDPDDDCGIAGCPSAPAVRHKERLAATVRELLADWSAGEPPANWENHTVPDYLAALAAWLDDSDGYYAGRGRAVPADGWQVAAEALRAATVYE
ncbi:DUF7660 family protein [Catellatospora sichuanensis]|uniref:DUF7660 family protein n=1 Tax=Catellatospora sichuanensis TaxID=1969805 RepID=UPI001183226E|nr:hypothetical protein [Catellatospora sichuanensis]